MAAGVGKTYAMLLAARERRAKTSTWSWGWSKPRPRGTKVLLEALKSCHPRNRLP